MYCIKLFYMNDASILNKKKSNIVKTRCYVINLFFINLHMTFACIPFYQRQHPAPPWYFYIRLCPEKQYLTGIFLASGQASINC